MEKISKKKVPWVFVTGISKGVGRSVSVKLVKRGYNVLGISRTEPEYISNYPNIHWFHCDLSTSFDQHEFLAKIKKHTDSINVIIFNAAQAQYGKILDIDITEQNKIINTNLLSTLFILKNLLPIMERNSQVIFVGSSAEYLPAPNMGIYAALKAAQSHIAMTLNVEYAHKKITFKVIKPGFINTEFSKSSGMPHNTLNEKLGISPDKVAEDILRLLSKKNFIMHSGLISKLLFIFSRFGVRLCYVISLMRHREKV